MHNDNPHSAALHARLELALHLAEALDLAESALEYRLLYAELLEVLAAPSRGGKSPLFSIRIHLCRSVFAA